MKRILVIGSIGLLLVMGCAKKQGAGGTIKGTVTYKGTPVNGAKLQFYSTAAQSPEKGPPLTITIPVSQQGTFESSNIAPGEYKIVVEPQAAQWKPKIPKGGDPAKAKEMQEKLQQMQGQDKPTIAFPKKYMSLMSTDLKCTIKQGEQPLALDLKD